jgi:hypothetical protein
LVLKAAAGSLEIVQKPVRYDMQASPPGLGALPWKRFRTRNIVLLDQIV